MDMQSAAFRDASPLDWSAITGVAPIPDTQRIVSPEEWESLRWDGARLAAKTPDEARRALRSRVASADAADDDAAAYDDDTPAGPQHARDYGVGRPLTAGALWVPWLPDAARSMGLPVVLVPGWASRGHGGMRVVEGVVGHHTATPDTAKGDYPSQNIVTNGRVGLSGPLCNLGLGRSGTVYVVAAGCAYHAGASRWIGFTDLNDEFLGIEAEDNGDGHWTAAMLDAYPRLVAGLLRYMRRGVDRYISHRGCAVPAGRKPDPAGIADDWMRLRAGALLAGGSTPAATKGARVDIDNIRIAPGAGQFRHVITVGEASAITARAWASAVVNGPEKGTVKLWPQGDRGGVGPMISWAINFRDGWSERPWVELPSGTTQVNIQYEFPNGGTIAFEAQPK